MNKGDIRPPINFQPGGGARWLGRLIAGKRVIFGLSAVQVFYLIPAVGIAMSRYWPWAIPAALFVVLVPRLLRR